MLPEHGDERGLHVDCPVGVLRLRTLLLSLEDGSPDVDDAASEVDVRHFEPEQLAYAHTRLGGHETTPCAESDHAQTYDRERCTLPRQCFGSSWTTSGSARRSTRSPGSPRCRPPVPCPTSEAGTSVRGKRTSSASPVSGARGSSAPTTRRAWRSCLPRGLGTSGS